MVNNKEKNKKLNRRVYSLISIGILCCVTGFINTVAYTDNIYGFEYDQGEVREMLCIIATHLYTEEINIVNSPHAVPVNYSEVLDFVVLDKTDETEYEFDVFDCVHFSETLHNNAEAYGIETGVVIVRFEDKCIGHAINVFNTTDRGLVFVDNTERDRIIRKLKPGSPIMYDNSFTCNPNNVELFIIYW